MNFTVFDKGWAVGNLDYGGGLYVSNANLKYTKNPPEDDPACYIGHGGHTYGYESA